MDVPLWVPLLTVVVVFAYFLLTTALLIWGERRIVGKMQSRIGPNRVGPFGILQVLVDGIKMFFKEDVNPSMVDRVIYAVAPLVGVITGFLTIAVIPLSGEITLFGETFVLQVADIEVGALWILAMGSVHVYSVFLAGWASQSPYPLMGGIRASAQMISYEIAQGLAVASVFIYTGSLRISDIVAGQAGDGLIAGMPGWYAIPLFPAFVIFVVGMVAEANRPPFDLAEAEGELVGGFHTEYSGMKFGMFMLSEFLSVVVQSAVVVTLFLGGPSGPTFGAPEPLASLLPIVWFTLKTAGFVFFFVLLRGSQPRYRYDKLMDLGWKVLIPVGLIWTLITAAFVLVGEQGGVPGGVRLALGGAAALIVVVLLALGPRKAVGVGDEHAPPEATTSPPPLATPSGGAERDPEHGPDRDPEEVR